MPNRKIILVVEDDPDTSDILVMGLKAEGCSAFSQPNRDEALAWIRQHGIPDVILLDWHMPGMEIGPFLTELLKLGPPPRVVLMTAGQVADEVAKTAGIPEVLRKPFLPTDLLEQIDGCHH